MSLRADIARLKEQYRGYPERTLPLRLIAQVERMEAALKIAHAHLSEMREAWRSGEVSSCNGRSGWLSNNNVGAEVAAREALKGMDEGE